MTEAESRVLHALRRICADGWPATVREVAAEAGLASFGDAQKRLIQLERLGMAETNPRESAQRRGWRPTREGLQQPTPEVS